MAPATTYWPPTTSPSRSLGVKENGLRQVGQKPSVRPGWPSRERPTGDPHDGQVRRSSGTIGSLRTAPAASTAGTGGTVVRPAPSRAPRSRVEDVPTRRVTLLPSAPARAEPSAVVASWSDVRDTVEGDCAAPAGIVATEAVVEGAADRSCPRGVAPCGPGDPQTSQYPSTIVPEQPGWVHHPGGARAAGRPVDDARRAGRAGRRGSGRPADVAVAVEDGARAAGLGAGGRAHGAPPASGCARCGCALPR